MILHTKFEEEIEIRESDIIHFEQGLPGFEEEKQFVLVPIEDTLFSILQSVSTKELAFFTVNPFLFFKEYDFELTESVQEQLNINNESDVMVQVILTINDPFEKSTANLQAPVVINHKENLAKQVVLTDSRYQTRHALTESTFVSQEG
ncbi:flagellar assembly protein FliW [Fictibacillus barbaricus]|uniref:Flagellar assembly factor FliW n=1 Tax=Fictibacillus barbaricus TaxID=182136 RepID=A0ABU1U132_9BACL|nr:flagellar assembly protein FliW [Fictibacillus barbaricus]MDR7073152.1 flagellar assembly factor FliW [Fictibacillus barbaricus]